MFESNLVEYFSRIHPITPFVFWIPVVAYVAHRSRARAELAFYVQILIVLAGLLAWSLAEYVLHRYVFHWLNDSSRGRRLHFLIHGVHHEYPHDRHRLVMPLGASIPLAILFYALFYVAFSGASLADPFFVGFTLGYLAYDGVHFAVHHFAGRNPLFRKLKRHHMLHHHIDQAGGFGVSSPLWDHVFRTLPSARTRR
jgi:dihydroceramide fatty acyl 2-hydroxylase